MEPDSSSDLRSRRPRQSEPRDRYVLHVSLFLLTLLSTIWAGGGMVARFDYYGLADRWIGSGDFAVNVDFVLDGLRFGGSLLLFLTVHEFGHYFAARYHRVRTSLPYYIPFPFNGIGTFGAVIRIREQIPSLRKLFDIGVAGPLAGFVVALGVLVYALVTLPGPEYMLGLSEHEPLKAFIGQYGTLPDEMLTIPSDGSLVLVVGTTPLYWFLTQFFADVPPMHEMYHYPYLFAAWLGLFFTALNLLPVGQLDGGHILYALVGPRWHGRLARGFVLLLLISGSIGLVHDVAAFSGPSLIRELLAWFGLAGIVFVFLYRLLDRDLRAVAPVLLGVILLAAASKIPGSPIAEIGYAGWLFWCLLLVFLIRVDHPPVLVHEPLSRGRRVLAYASLMIFVLCFSMKPLYIIG